MAIVFPLHLVSPALFVTGEVLGIHGCMLRLDPDMLCAFEGVSL